MLFIKSINVNASPYYPMTFQGFNEMFYYHNKQGERESLDLGMIVYETYNGVSYQSNTEKAWLCDEYVVNLGDKAYDFLTHLYSDHELVVHNKYISFKYQDKHYLEDMQDYEYIDKEEYFELDKEYFKLVQQRRNEYIKFKESFDNTK